MWWQEHWAELLAIVAVVAGWATLQATLVSHVRETRESFKIVNLRLDRVNGRLDNHGDRVNELEKGIDHLRGKLGMPR